MEEFIHIHSDKFPILPGEEKELVNEGMYGKALALYLQEKLSERGYAIPFVCCEDWGWWVELKGAPFVFGVRIYCHPEAHGTKDLYCTGGTTTRRKWSWRRFRFVDTMPWVKKLHEDLIAIFRADSEVKVINTSLDGPFL